MGRLGFNCHFTTGQPTTCKLSRTPLHQLALAEYLGKFQYRLTLSKITNISLTKCPTYGALWVQLPLYRWPACDPKALSGAAAAVHPGLRVGQLHASPAAPPSPSLAMERLSASSCTVLSQAPRDPPAPGQKHAGHTSPPIRPVASSCDPTGSSSLNPLLSHPRRLAPMRHVMSCYRCNNC